MTDLHRPLFAAGYRLAQGPWLALGEAFSVPVAGYLSGMLGASGALPDTLVRRDGNDWKLDRPEPRKVKRVDHEQDPIFGGRR